MEDKASHDEKCISKGGGGGADDFPQSLPALCFAKGRLSKRSLFRKRERHFLFSAAVLGGGVQMGLISDKTTHCLNGRTPFIFR